MDFIKRHRIVVFFVLAYALAWGAIPWNSFFAPGVLLAALIVVAVTEGLPGLKALGARLIRWRVSWVWYALAIGVPLTGASDLGSHQHRTRCIAARARDAVTLVQPPDGHRPARPQPHRGSVDGGAELPRLRPARAANPPLADGGDRDHGGTDRRLARTAVHHAGVRRPPHRAVTTMAVTFWYAWLFNHASGSALLTLIAHGTEGAVLTSSLWSAGADLERLNYLNAIVWCTVALALLIFDRRFWTQRPPVYAAPAEPTDQSRHESPTATPSQS